MVLLAAGGLLLLAEHPPAYGRRLGWVHPFTVIFFSFSSVAMMAVNFKLHDT